MDTLASWLRPLGLDQYVPLFESHGIDLHSLPLLSEEDLVKLGVLLGHRRLLLKAICTLDNDRHVVASTMQSAQDAGRRQLTVLFCDLVGSTELARRLDAEMLRDLMHAYQRACGDIVSRYAGHVAQYLGDGIVVYFGFPQAHEDDAERAVRAALEMVAVVSKVPASTPLRVHVGIATGSVVVGDSGAWDALRSNAAVGETPNLAARLTALADPDQIVISSGTCRLLGNAFRIEDLGEHALKGITEPVKAYLVRDLTRSESRFDANRKSRYTPFVGRESEVALLLSRWENAREGEGQVVLLTGEPGIGKSRIAHVLSRHLADTHHLRQFYQCSPYHNGSAFYPLVEPFERAFGFERDDTPEQKLDRLEASLNLDFGELPLVAPFFAALLSLPTDRYPTQMLAPPKHREKTIAALVEQMLRLAKRQPILMICEDAQWADPATLETMALMVERIREAPVLLIVTCRPEFVPPWTGHGNVTLLHLNRLSRRQGEAITDQLVSGKPLPGELLDQILERTDGVPLFVEELTQAVLESGILRDAGDHWELPGPLPPPAIPTTIQDSLMARLDRLGTCKEVAQIGACIGREFDRGLLAAISPTNEADLQESLDRLVDSGLVFRHGSGGEAVYMFKHALVRDVAYDGLLMSRRKQIHAAIARALATELKDRTKTRPELLALHLTRADLVDLALPQWRTAARSAITKNRHREALEYVDAGLALIDRAAIEHRADHEVGLLVTGAACHWVLTGYACKQASALWARVEALVDQVTDPRLSILALSGINICAYAGADTRKALATAERLILLGESTQDIDSKLVAFSCVGPILHQQGQFERCTRLLEFVIDSYRPDRQSGFGRLNDSKVTACNWLSYCHLAGGRFDQAKHYARLAVDHATDIAQPFVLSQALSVAARAFAETGDEETTFDLCDRCIELCDTQNLPFWKGWAMVYEGVALERRGKHQQAEARLAQAIEHLAAGGGRSDLGYMYACRAQALANLGRFDDARRDIETGCAECISTGQMISLIELAYSRAVTELLDPGSDARVAEHWFNVALTDARSLGLTLVELRAAMSLASLWKADGKCRQAQVVLGRVVSACAEGLDCQDVTAAIALLDSLDDVDRKT
ncbi:AAA family ATPase [Caballeronia novacaledonica]|uniref:adenylate/guanylate cyclase domain-containing protein n=1 Tax=Caballeronia novacaledonica TaxID=1544861 RepID=UPI001EE31A26|nr:adenylate/guanylate cyclase domain-containing protein [Caballeronia novacaledonica]GJH13212.1 AAA family ATPase [Caballeronia novacaledonica]